MVATGPFLRPAFTPPPAKLALAKAMRLAVPAMTNELDPNGLSRDAGVVRSYVSDPLVHNKVSVRAGLDILEAGEWAIAHAGEFSLPSLLTHGALDSIASLKGTQDFASRVPGDCTLKVWDGLYHEIHNEPEKQEVLDFVIGWLDRH